MQKALRQLIMTLLGSRSIDFVSFFNSHFKFFFIWSTTTKFRLDDIKLQLQSSLSLWSSPSATRLGTSPASGLLLVGPSGSGKTSLLMWMTQNKQFNSVTLSGYVFVTNKSSCTFFFCFALILK
jgi:hypothetical protein